MKKVRNKKIDGRFYTDEYIDRLVKKIYQLEDRIDKAIEYIKTHSNCGGSVQEGKFIIEHIEEIYDGMKLISILRGEENESY